VQVESGGGVVHGYGLAAAQLMRIRAKKIPLTVSIDKIAASGGYLMACVANKILCAPFAIIGSIGVVVQLPNLHRYLKNKNILYIRHVIEKLKDYTIPYIRIDLIEKYNIYTTFTQIYKNIFDLMPPAPVPFFMARSWMRSNKRGTQFITLGFTSAMFLASNSKLWAKAILAPEYRQTW